MIVLLLRVFLSIRAQVNSCLEKQNYSTRGWAQSCCSLLSSPTKHILPYALYDTLWIFRLLRDWNIKMSMQHLLACMHLFFTLICFSCLPDVKCSNVFGRVSCTKRHVTTSWWHFLWSLRPVPFLSFSNSYKACKDIPAVIVCCHVLCLHNFMKRIHSIRELLFQRALEGLTVPRHEC